MIAFPRVPEEGMRQKKYRDPTSSEVFAVLPAAGSKQKRIGHARDKTAEPAKSRDASFALSYRHEAVARFSNQHSGSRKFQEKPVPSALGLNQKLPGLT